MTMRSSGIARLVAAAGMSMFIAASTNAAEAPYRAREIVYKENGRLDAEIMSLCDAKRSVADAATPPTRRSKKPDDRPSQEVDIRIDRIARLGMGNSGVGWGGLEFGITAIVADQPDIQTQFLCRKRVMGIGGRSAYCDSIDACSREVTKNIAAWLKIVKPTGVGDSKG